MDDSIAHFVKISGRNGVSQTFVESLKTTISARVWTATTAGVSAADTATPTTTKTLRTGIGGIERGLAEKQKLTDQHISIAFQDLDKLMEMAKDMVAVTKVVSSKIRERHGEVSEDETVRFKSYLMSLGIDDPVTRDGTRSSSEYFMKLSQQLCEMLLDPITEAGVLGRCFDTMVAHIAIRKAATGDALADTAKEAPGTISIQECIAYYLKLPAENFFNDNVNYDLRPTSNEAKREAAKKIGFLISLQDHFIHEIMLKRFYESCDQYCTSLACNVDFIDSLAEVKSDGSRAVTAVKPFKLDTNAS
ncbi:hypothetical protein AND_007886 [Anopheles darlingi]|uniref:Vacuolar protein-sorting-associated protein 36 n=1 Tax=Anopheles darlingi TaxID=43151 RepID=W5JCD9_ANODA|nr:hypothetical protein AND_007886 [Anopheles darlingi]